MLTSEWHRRILALKEKKKKKKESEESTDLRWSGNLTSSPPVRREGVGKVVEGGGGGGGGYKWAKRVRVRMQRSAPFHPQMFISLIPKRRGNALRSSLWLDEPTLQGTRTYTRA